MNAPLSGDVALAEMAAQGDPIGIRTIAERLAPIVARSASRRGRSTQEAEDLAAVGVARALDPKILQRYRGAGSLTGYLSTVAERAMIATVRSKQFQFERMEGAGLRPDQSGVSASAETTFHDAEVHSDIRRALGRLPERAEAVVRLRAEGFSEAEIAAGLDMPVGTVKSTYSRARAQLRIELAHLASLGLTHSTSPTRRKEEST